MKLLADDRIEISGEKQKLCVEMLHSPKAGFRQTSEWFAPAPTRGDGRLFEGAAPLKGEPQWHGRFASAPLAEAEFIALLDVGCASPKAALRKMGDGWSVQVGRKTVEIGSENVVK